MDDSHFDPFLLSCCWKTRGKTTAQQTPVCFAQSVPPKQFFVPKIIKVGQNPIYIRYIYTYIYVCLIYIQCIYIQ